YMEEAEALADSVCIMDHGSIIAEGSPRELAERFGEETVIEFQSEDAPADAIERLRAFSDEAKLDGEMIRLETSDLPRTMEGLFAWAREAGIPLGQLVVRQPNLEDVFLALTGRRLRE
ncbi:ABC transporter ATP-binding protein, partial [Candidatus Acetothermia bacterium]